MSRETIRTPRRIMGMVMACLAQEAYCGNIVHRHNHHSHSNRDNYRSHSNRFSLLSHRRCLHRRAGLHPLRRFRLCRKGIRDLRIHRPNRCSHTSLCHQTSNNHGRREDDRPLRMPCRRCGTGPAKSSRLAQGTMLSLPRWSSIDHALLNHCAASPGDARGLCGSRVSCASVASVGRTLARAPKKSGEQPSPSLPLCWSCCYHRV